MNIEDFQKRIRTADEIVSALYFRFKEWSKRGFGADDVTWCEVKRDVIDLLKIKKEDPGALENASPTVQGEPVAFCEDAATQPTEQQPDVTQLVEALEQIERWDGFPSTGETWEGSDKPVSYGAAFGSYGERDFMREVARKALAAYRQQGGEA